MDLFIAISRDLFNKPRVMKFLTFRVLFCDIQRKSQSEKIVKMHGIYFVIPRK